MTNGIWYFNWIKTIQTTDQNLMQRFTNNTTAPRSPRSGTEGVEQKKLWKLDYTIEIPAGKHTNHAGIFKLMAVLAYTAGTFEINLIAETDLILGLPNEYLKEDDAKGWSKYLFNCRRVWKTGKEFDVAHVVITASQRLGSLKQNPRVWNTLKKEGVYVKAREFTNYNDKLAIGWLVGLNPAMSGKETLTNTLKSILDNKTSIVDTEIVIESRSIKQFVRGSKTMAHMQAWMVYGNTQYINEIEGCMDAYLSQETQEIALGLCICAFVLTARTKTALPIKVIRIQDQNKLISTMAMVELYNHIHYQEGIKFTPAITDLFNHYAEGDLDSVAVTFWELLDEQLQDLKNSKIRYRKSSKLRIFSWRDSTR